MLKNGWYILNYHDISWEENPYIAGIGGTFPPDIFAEHLHALSRAGKLVSIQEGFKRFCEGSIDEVLISFWFDDGFLGVRKYAMPIMEQYGVKGAISINSRFTLREEMFWRLKLSYLAHVDGLRFLRSRLKPLGYTLDMSVKTFVMDRFSSEIVALIDEIYCQFTTPMQRADAFRIFDTIEGIKTLQQNGWEISNHSSAHYPVSEASHIDYFAEEFLECEKVLHAHLEEETDFWVLPFDRKSLDNQTLLKHLHDTDQRGRHLVRVGNRVNTTYDPQQKIIYRIDPPQICGDMFIRTLRTLIGV